MVIACLCADDRHLLKNILLECRHPAWNKYVCLSPLLPCQVVSIIVEMQLCVPAYQQSCVLVRCVLEDIIVALQAPMLIICKMCQAG